MGSVERILPVMIVGILLSGCDENYQFEGLYECEVEQERNNRAFSHGENHFPLGTLKAEVAVSGDNFTVFDMKNGDYHSLPLIKIGDIFVGRGNNRTDTFSPETMSFSIANSRGREFSERFTGCTLKE